MFSFPSSLGEELIIIPGVSGISANVVMIWPNHVLNFVDQMGTSVSLVASHDSKPKSS